MHMIKRTISIFFKSFLRTSSKRYSTQTNHTHRRLSYIHQTCRLPEPNRDTWYWHRNAWSHAGTYWNWWQRKFRRGRIWTTIHYFNAQNCDGK